MTDFGDCYLDHCRTTGISERFQKSCDHVIVGSEEARLRACLRPPLKLHVHVSCMQLSRRLSDAGMREKELNRSTAQARTRRKAWSQAAVSSPHCANAGTDATKYVAFFADAQLKKVEVSGGPVQTICDGPGGRGGTWNKDGVIVLAPNTT